MNYSLERFNGESMKDHSWNGVGQFAAQKEAEWHNVGGDDWSTGGEAGSGTKSDDA